MEDSRQLDIIYRISVCQSYVKAVAQLCAIQEILQGRPTSLMPKNSFELNALIEDFLNRSESIFRDELRAMVSEDPTGKMAQQFKDFLENDIP